MSNNKLQLGVGGMFEPPERLAPVTIRCQYSGKGWMRIYDPIECEFHEIENRDAPDWAHSRARAKLPKKSFFTTK